MFIKTKHLTALLLEDIFNLGRQTYVYNFHFFSPEIWNKISFLKFVYCTVLSENISLNNRIIHMAAGISLFS